MAKGTPRRHHYVPQFLLEGFTSEAGKLICYDAELKKHWVSTPRQCGYEKDLHTHYGLDGKVDHASIEQLIANDIDGPGSSVVKTLRSQGKLEQRDWGGFIRFVAAQMVRTPSHIQRMQEMNQPVVTEQLKRMAADDKLTRDLREKLVETGMPEEEVRRFLREYPEQSNLGLNPQFVLLANLAGLSPMQDILGQMYWNFRSVPCESGSLFIGDHPVVMRGRTKTPAGVSIAIVRKNVELLMPLATNLLAVARWDLSSPREPLTAQEVSKVNEYSMRHALRCVYGPNSSDEVLRTFLALHGRGHKIVHERKQVGKGTCFISRWEEGED